MVNAKDSLSAGAAGHGDIGMAIPYEQQYQAFMASAVHQQQHHHFHQYPAGLIPAPPVAMPVHVPVSSLTPYSAQIAVLPPQPPLIPLRPDDRLHSLPPPPPPPTGCYQDYSSSYGNNTATMNMIQTPPFHSNNHDQESGAGFSNSFNMVPSVPPTSHFHLMSPSSTNYTSTQIFEDINNLEANCHDYHMILRKDLTNIDVQPARRTIWLPKKDAECSLPVLEDKDGLILEMDDFELPTVWKFKYRYYATPSSRRYVLETIGESFVKRHGLQAKDVLFIYINKKSGRYICCPCGED